MSAAVQLVLFGKNEEEELEGFIETARWERDVDLQTCLALVGREVKGSGKHLDTGGAGRGVGDRRATVAPPPLPPVPGTQQVDPDPLGEIPFNLLDNSSKLWLICDGCSTPLQVHPDVHHIYCDVQNLAFFCRYLTGVPCSREPSSWDRYSMMTFQRRRKQREAQVLVHGSELKEDAASSRPAPGPPLRQPRPSPRHAAQVARAPARLARKHADGSKRDPEPQKDPRPKKAAGKSQCIQHGPQVRTVSSKSPAPGSHRKLERSSARSPDVRGVQKMKKLRSAPDRT